ncbi:TorF family putative porin [Silanimonas algicola]
MNRKTLLAALLLATLPGAAAAEGFNWNATVVSDYLYRGVDQNDDQPALQLGAGYGFANGLYVGTWASNVDFGDSTDIEVDTFVGWAGDLSDTTSFDVQLVRYNYLNEPNGTDYAYNELISKLGFAEDYTFTFGYTNDYFNAGGDSFYYNLAGSWGFAEHYTFSAAVGYTTISGDLKRVDGLQNFADYSVGVSREFGPATVALSYVNTDGNAEDNFGPDLAEDKFLLTIGFGG